MIILIHIILFFAQLPPPILPSAPEQAPIDGGLSLLAVAGGAYAWNRLKKREKP
jgi:hypothetical protein